MSAWRARLLLRRGSAPWLETTPASLGEGIFNISLSNTAFVALAQMLLALLPSSTAAKLCVSFGFVMLCQRLQQ